MALRQLGHAQPAKDAVQATLWLTTMTDSHVDTVGLRAINEPKSGHFKSFIRRIIFFDGSDDTRKRLHR